MGRSSRYLLRLFKFCCFLLFLGKFNGLLVSSQADVEEVRLPASVNYNSKTQASELSTKWKLIANPETFIEAVSPGLKMKGKKALKTVLDLKTIILSFVVPVVLLPILYELEGDTGRCAYGVAILIVYWVLEVFPLPITSLLPVLIFPALGVLPATEVCSEYVKDTSITVLCIFGIVALVEKWGLHKRVALAILMLFGTKPHWLILGMFVSTCVLSMFITAGVAVLMLPIVRSMVDKLRHVEPTQPLDDIELKEVQDDIISVSSDETNTQEQARAAHEDEINRLFKALALCIAYGTTLGSTATLTGAPENFIMVELTAELYRSNGLESQVTFISWLVFTLPIVVIVVILGWMWFVILFLRGKGLFRRATSSDAMMKAEIRVKEHIRDEYKSLGPWTYPEIVSMVFLAILIIFFITRDLYFAPGWSSLFKTGYVGASGPACLLLVFLFIVPAKSPIQLWRRDKSENTDNSGGESRFAPLLTWRDVERAMPWGIMLLVGSAFALVRASQVSGLTKLVGTYFDSFVSLEPWLLTVVITFVTTFLTEFISNSATITLLLPIVGQVAIMAGIDPLGLIFPLTLAGKFAFMMPIATPPNAISYSLGALRIIDMAVAGFVLNILTLITLNIGAQTWGKAYFHWDVLPEAMRTNSTIITNNITVLA